jgi:hypothetical protein
MREADRVLVLVLRLQLPAGSLASARDRVAASWKHDRVAERPRIETELGSSDRPAVQYGTSELEHAER